MRLSNLKVSCVTFIPHPHHFHDGLIIAPIPPFVCRASAVISSTITGRLRVSDRLPTAGRKFQVAGCFERGHQYSAAPVAAPPAAVPFASRPTAINPIKGGEVGDQRRKRIADQKHINREIETERRPADGERARRRAGFNGPCGGPRGGGRL